MDREAWQTTVHGVPKSQIRLSSGNMGTGWWVPEAPDGLRANIPQDSGTEFAQGIHLVTAQCSRWRLCIC